MTATTTTKRTIRNIAAFIGKRVDPNVWVIPKGYALCIVTGKLHAEADLEASFDHTRLTDAELEAAGVTGVEDADWLSGEGYEAIMDALRAAGLYEVYVNGREEAPVTVEPVRMEEKKHTYTVTLPDGTQATRTTARTYTHVVALVCDSGSWTVAHWCGSLELAQKQFDPIVARGIAPQVALIPVGNPREGGSATPTTSKAKTPHAIRAQAIDRYTTDLAAARATLRIEVREYGWLLHEALDGIAESARYALAYGDYGSHAANRTLTRAALLLRSALKTDTISAWQSFNKFAQDVVLRRAGELAHI